MNRTVRPFATSRSTLGTLTAILLACTPLPAVSQSPDLPTDVRPAILGSFVDDYGITYRVTRDEWLQGDEARYDIAEWNVEGRYLVARNGADNPSEPGLWTRIDWVEFEAGADFEWAFCYAVYDAESVEAARAATATRRESPRDGCNGYPFSRMRRVADRAGEVSASSRLGRDPVGGEIARARPIHDGQMGTTTPGRRP